MASKISIKALHTETHVSMLGGNSTDVPGEEGDLSLRLTEVSHVDHSQTTPYHLPTLASSHF